jgi:hypothetical protein
MKKFDVMIELKVEIETDLSLDYSAWNGGQRMASYLLLGVASYGTR